MGRWNDFGEDESCESSSGADDSDREDGENFSHDFDLEDVFREGEVLSLFEASARCTVKSMEMLSVDQINELPRCLLEKLSWLVTPHILHTLTEIFDRKGIDTQPVWKEHLRRRFRGEYLVWYVRRKTMKEYQQNYHQRYIDLHFVDVLHYIRIPAFYKTFDPMRSVRQYPEELKESRRKQRSITFMDINGVHQIHATAELDRTFSDEQEAFRELVRYSPYVKKLRIRWKHLIIIGMCPDVLNNLLKSVTELNICGLTEDSYSSVRPILSILLTHGKIDTFGVNFLDLRVGSFDDLMNLCLGNAPLDTNIDDQSDEWETIKSLSDPSDWTDSDSDLYGNDHDLPGNGQELPGYGHDFPVNDHDLPGNGQDLPGHDDDFPGNDHELPGNYPAVPEDNHNCSENNLDLPENKHVLSGYDVDLPENTHDLPGSNPLLPGKVDDLHGNEPDLSEYDHDLQQNNDSLENDLDHPKDDCDFAENDHDLSENNNDLPGNDHDLPRNDFDLPEKDHDLPGSYLDLPEYNDDLPEKDNDLPKNGHDPYIPENNFVQIVPNW